VGQGELVALKCRRQTLEALASGLIGYGNAAGAPDWLVSGVWLDAAQARYLATASVEVLSDGFVARPLSIATPDELVRHIDAELPNVGDRLLARGNGMDLPRAEVPPMPQTLTRWPAGPYQTQVLVRVSRRATSTHQVACALLFAGERKASILVGTDVSTLAMVLSDDPELIALYRKDCEALTPAEYLDRCGD
jgi:hypothetical protein